MSGELETLFSSAARVEILRLFLLHPEQQFYQREIERETGQPIRAVQREVQRLVDIGLLGRAAEGNRVLFGINRAFPLLAELQALFQGPGAPAKERRQVGSGKAAAPQSAPGEPGFDWMESRPGPPLPSALRKRQIESEWDRSY